VLEFDRRSNHPVDDYDADILLTTLSRLKRSRKKKGYSDESTDILLSMRWAKVVQDQKQQRTAMM
jgi:hypothetical protein